MKGQLRLAEVNVKDSAAMTRWAHGMCRGQPIEHLAGVYGVEPTMKGGCGGVRETSPQGGAADCGSCMRIRAEEDQRLGKV